MSQPPTYSNPEFDQYAADYDAALARGISVSGEDKTYFAQGRVEWLGKCLAKLRAPSKTIMDFGCGTGSATPYLRTLTSGATIVGVDISARSLDVARSLFGNATTHFHEFSQHQPTGEMDLAFCNGVFHHIPLAERAKAIAYVRDALKPGGLFALWENNPWNPGTRLVMSRIPFDRDAIPLPPTESLRLLRAGGFEILRTDFLFLFPRMLSWLRWIEPRVAKLPCGAQYQVLCRKSHL